MAKSHNTRLRTKSKKQPHPLEALPFIATWGDPGVRKRRKDHVGRCFWHVKRSGNAWLDSLTGEKYALKYLEYLATAEIGCLPSIVADMPRQRSTMEIAFLSLIDTAARSGRFAAEQESAYWDKRRAPGSPSAA